MDFGVVSVETATLQYMFMCRYVMTSHMWYNIETAWSIDWATNLARPRIINFDDLNSFKINVQLITLLMSLRRGCWRISGILVWRVIIIIYGK